MREGIYPPRSSTSLLFSKVGLIPVPFPCIAAPHVLQPVTVLTTSSCRKFDQETHPKATSSTCHDSSNLTNLPFHSASVPASKDIVPRALPTRTAIGFPIVAGGSAGDNNNGALNMTACRSSSAFLQVAPRTGYA